MGKLLLIVLVKIAVTSATHVGMLQALGHEQDIVYNCGREMEVNTEAVIRSRAEYLLMTDYGHEMPGRKQLEAAGVQVIPMAEWREEDPLARAEWLRMVGAIVGEQQRADSLLNVVRREYIRLATMVREHTAQSSSPTPLVLSGQDYRGTWYVPTDHSYMGRLITDAGGRVAEGSGSKAMTIEQVIREFGQAPIWIGVQARTYRELDAMDSKHAWFRARKEKKVYNWLQRVDKNGVSEFWISGVYRPDWILSDLIWAFHPELMPGYQTHYLAPLD